MVVPQAFAIPYTSRTDIVNILRKTMRRFRSCVLPHEEGSESKTQDLTPAFCPAFCLKSLEGRGLYAVLNIAIMTLQT
jgi:hypothetical protein